MTEAQQLTAALIAAANSAAEAAGAIREAQQGASSSTGPSRSKFSDAGKMVRMPDPFIAVGVDEEQARWPDFLLNLKAWIYAADASFEQDFALIDAHINDPVEMDGLTDDSKTRSMELHSVLIGLLRNRSLKVLRSIDGRNGLEVYRQLVKLYTPNTKPRSMAILSAIMNLPHFGKEKSLYDHVHGLDRLIAEYQKACGTSVSDDVALSVLVRCLPGHIRQHVQLSLDDASSYADVRTKVLSFESVTANWSTSRIHNEFGISTGNSAGTPGSTTGPTPMEIDQMQWGQQQLNQFKGSHKGKGKGKGKYEFGKGKSKGKGKGKDKGKGKGKFNQNDQRPSNSNSDSRTSSNNCLYCGKPGQVAA